MVIIEALVLTEGISILKPASNKEVKRRSLVEQDTISKLDKRLKVKKAKAMSHRN